MLVTPALGIDANVAGIPRSRADLDPVDKGTKARAARHAEAGTKLVRRPSIPLRYPRKANTVSSTQQAKMRPMKRFEHLGQHVFLESAKNMSAIPQGSVDFFITSPPYWNLKDYGNSEEEIGSGSYEEYIEDLSRVWAECFRVASENAILIINVNSRRVKGRLYPIPFDIVSSMKDWELWDHNIWHIPNALPQPNAYMERLLDNKFESLLVFRKGNHRDYKFHKPRVPQKYITADPRSEKRNSRGRCLGNILRVPAYRPPNIKKMSYHVAAYPEELVAFFLSCYTDPGDTVLDPFLGSGTTLKVSRVMERRGIGFEVHSEFSDLIRTRIEEEWELPDWKDIDLIHSTTSQTGSTKSRKAHFSRNDVVKKVTAPLFTWEDE